MVTSRQKSFEGGGVGFQQIFYPLKNLKPILLRTIIDSISSKKNEKKFLTGKVESCNKTVSNKFFKIRQ